MICGDAGAGKSSLTASFCLEGAEFLTDDVTPLLFRDGKPFIWLYLTGLSFGVIP